MATRSDSSRLLHEIRLVGHSRGLARADAHENAFVEPVETRSCG
ncbi:MAG: hypothetical protein JWO36_1810, partial [Myxococcales bacterium]|nr:hypothetical protein [Myxococcales bacterium]